MMKQVTKANLMKKWLTLLILVKGDIKAMKNDKKLVRKYSKKLSQSLKLTKKLIKNLKT